MKITSTPPQRFRPRVHYEGDAGYSVDMDGMIRIKTFGEDRHFTIYLDPTDISALVATLRMREQRHG